jgi:pimeloyl-ACP methyl ester carboxylesterase
MKNWTCCFLACLCLAAVSHTAHAGCPAGSKITEWVPAGELCLAAGTFRKTEDAARDLIVVVHGDTSSGGPADTLFPFAQRLAGTGVVAVALLRPGYSDKAGRTSGGDNHGRVDSYTPANIAAIGNAIEALKKHYQPARTILVAHSGGAAISGVLIGKIPGIVQAAVLISCPCDLARWRKERSGSAWTRSESPSSYIQKVPTSTTVIAITGTEDDNTRPGLAEDYVAQLAKRGVPAKFELAKGAGHNFRDELAMVAAAAVRRLLGP